MKKAERKRVSLLANLGDLNRPVRVRPVRLMRREWWAISPEDTWPGMVMDLRRLGFEAIAWKDEVLVRESSPAYDPQMEGPAAPAGLKPMPFIQQKIYVRKEPEPTSFDRFGYVDEYDEYEDEDLEDEYEAEDVEEEYEDEFEPEDLDDEDE